MVFVKKEKINRIVRKIVVDYSGSKNKKTDGFDESKNDTGTNDKSVSL